MAKRLNITGSIFSIPSYIQDMLKKSWAAETLIAALYFDYRVRYVLGISDFDREQICINTISNFRKQFYQDALENDRDHLEEDLKGFIANLIKLTGMNTSLAQQEPMMNSANPKKMSRLELIYTVNQAMVKLLDQNKAVIEVLKDTQAFKNLARLLQEQADHLGPKNPKEITAKSMLNLHISEATNRVKGKNNSVGYITNIVGARDREKGLSMIVHYEKQPNIVSDSELGLKDVNTLRGVTTLGSDGYYHSWDIALDAEEKGLKLDFSVLNSRISDQAFSSPVYQQCRNRAKLDKKDFAACLQLNCFIIKEKLCYFIVMITDKKLIADRYQNLLAKSFHQTLGDFRAGVEGVSSILYRIYGFKKLSVRGLTRSRIWDHCKVMGYTLRSFFDYCRKNGLDALSCSLIIKTLNPFMRYFQIEWFYSF